MHTIKHAIGVFLAVPFFAAISGSAPHAQARGGPEAPYTLTDLGMPPRTSGLDWACINDCGQVLISGQRGDGTEKAYPGYQKISFLWEKGKFTDLGRLPGMIGTQAARINNKGQVVGHAFGRRTGHAFLWQKGTMTDLGGLPGGDDSNAFSINDRGQIVGSANVNRSFQRHAVLWENGRITDLGMLPGCRHAEARDINNQGEIVGRCEFSRYGVGVTLDDDAYLSAVWNRGRSIFAFLWRNGSMSELGRPMDDYMWAYKINNLGQVFGWAIIAEDMRPVLWQGREMLDLRVAADGKDIEPSWMNDHGQVVGFCETGKSNGAKEHHGERHAVVCQDGKMTDLDALLGTPQIRLVSAYCVNNSGQIVGKGTNNGREFIYLLTPTHANAPRALRGAEKKGIAATAALHVILPQESELKSVSPESRGTIRRLLYDVWKLDLTLEQEQQLRKIQDNFAWKLTESDVLAKKRKQPPGEKSDASKSRQTSSQPPRTSSHQRQEKVDSGDRGWHALEVQMMERVMAILTPEQKRKLNQEKTLFRLMMDQLNSGGTIRDCDPRHRRIFPGALPLRGAPRAIAP